MKRIGLQTKEVLAAQCVGVNLFGRTAEKGNDVAENRAQKAVLLIALLKNLRAEAALAGGEVKNFLVEIVNLQSVGYQPADLPAAAAELAAYGDYEGGSHKGKQLSDAFAEFLYFNHQEHDGEDGGY